MTDALVRDGKLVAAAINAAPAAAITSLAAASDPVERAALAIVAARVGASADILIPLLGNEGLDGQAAAWALGRLGAERALLTAVSDGDLDTRTNGYHGLIVLAAMGKASPAVAPAMLARVDAENERAKSGRTGLGEHACRVLAVLGAPETVARIQQVIDADRFCDRFELSRLRKAVEDKGRDSEAIATHAGDWTSSFADHLFVAAAPVPAPVAKPAAASKLASPAKPNSPSKAAAPPKPPTPAPADAGVDYGAYAPPGEAGPVMSGEADADESTMEGELPSEGGGTPVDWKAFAVSPEATALPPQLKGLAGQLGPLLEQLAQRAIRAQLTDLNAQEFVALLLQVLPQALPQQHVQMALSPQAINVYQAIVKFLVRTGAATQGDELVQAVKLVRKQMQEQIRRAGILNGPDYSDPDEAKKPSLAP